ncbi:hypothetical protein [Paenibacillus sp. 481]|nr:hypothetical protein [Paenibacillus sp. 481]
MREGQLCRATASRPPYAQRSLILSLATQPAKKPRMAFWKTGAAG